MKKEYTISVFTEDRIGLLNRVSIIFTRRHINIHSITASDSEVKGVHRYTIVIKEELALVKKVVAQLEKQVEVVRAFYHEEDSIVYQEIALYKIPTSVLAGGGAVESIVRNHNARLLTMETDYTVIEKTGHKDETQHLFDELSPYGILEFARSGRVAITKPMKAFKSYLEEMEAESGQ